MPWRAALVQSSIGGSFFAAAHVVPRLHLVRQFQPGQVLGLVLVAWRVWNAVVFAQDGCASAIFHCCELAIFPVCFHTGSLLESRRVPALVPADGLDADEHAQNAQECHHVAHSPRRLILEIGSGSGPGPHQCEQNLQSRSLGRKHGRTSHFPRATVRQLQKVYMVSWIISRYLSFLFSSFALWPVTNLPLAADV